MHASGGGGAFWREQAGGVPELPASCSRWLLGLQHLAPASGDLGPERRVRRRSSVPQVAVAAAGGSEALLRGIDVVLPLRYSLTSLTFNQHCVLLVKTFSGAG